MFTQRVSLLSVLGFMLFIVVISPFSTFAQEKPVDMVHWIYVGFPPYFVLEGESAKKGVADEVTALIQKNLPTYTHEESVGSITRLLTDLKAGKKVCNVAWLRTPEREEFMQFSTTPAIIMPPHGITIKRSKLSLFDKKKIVSLEELLNNPTLRLGIAEGRSYGKDLDAMLKKYEGQKHVYARSGKELYKGLFQMLMADRIDYLLGYPMEAMYFAGEFGVSDQIVNIALEESAEYRLTYVGCSKTEWGKQVIDHIDDILKKERTSDQYRAFHERWLDENSLEVFRKAYSDIFLSTGK